MPPAGRKAKTLTLIDGKFVDRRHAVVSVFDNALLYAEGLFETCLAVDDRIVFLNDHLNRLYRGSAITGVRVPVSRKTVTEWMKKLVAKHPARLKKVRLTLTSGEAARWTGRQGPPRVIISVAPHQFQTRPFKIHVSDLLIDENSVFRRIKTISYALHAAALKRANQNRCDDALLLNEKGKVAEVTSANIFWVRKGRVYTPAIRDGCLEGVTRQRVLNVAARLKLTVIEKSDSLRGLLTAEEIFISSSLKLVAPVSTILYGREQHHFPVGQITQAVQERFARLVKYPG